jgi:DNA-binding NtrC family response regulator
VTSGGGADTLRELGDAVAGLVELLLDRRVPLDDAVQAFEARYVRSSLARHHGNLSQAAASLGIHRNTLRTKLRRNGVATSRGR